ncbi:hypothetical protein AgCh_039467 [Apium graveolens]
MAVQIETGDEGSGILRNTPDGKRLKVEGSISKYLAIRKCAKAGTGLPNGLLLTKVFKWYGVELRDKDFVLVTDLFDLKTLTQSNLNFDKDGQLIHIESVVVGFAEGTSASGPSDGLSTHTLRSCDIDDMEDVVAALLKKEQTKESTADKDNKDELEKTDARLKFDELLMITGDNLKMKRNQLSGHQKRQKKLKAAEAEKLQMGSLDKFFEKKITNSGDIGVPIENIDIRKESENEAT